MAIEEKKLPTVIFKGNGKFMLVPSKKYPQLQDLLKDIVATDIEINAVVDDFTIWAMSDVSIAIIKRVIYILSFFERLFKPLGISVEIEDSTISVFKKVDDEK